MSTNLMKLYTLKLKTYLKKINNYKTKSKTMPIHKNKIFQWNKLVTLRGTKLVNQAVFYLVGV